jgi:hypothetical protein
MMQYFFRAIIQDAITKEPKLKFVTLESMDDLSIVFSDAYDEVFKQIEDPARWYIRELHLLNYEVM